MEPNAQGQTATNSTAASSGDGSPSAAVAGINSECSTNALDLDRGALRSTGGILRSRAFAKHRQRAQQQITQQGEDAAASSPVPALPSEVFDDTATSAATLAAADTSGELATGASIEGAASAGGTATTEALVQHLEKVMPLDAPCPAPSGMDPVADEVMNGLVIDAIETVDAFFMTNRAMLPKEKDLKEKALAWLVAVSVRQPPPDDAGKAGKRLRTNGSKAAKAIVAAEKAARKGAGGTRVTTLLHAPCLGLTPPTVRSVQSVPEAVPAASAAVPAYPNTSDDSGYDSYGSEAAIERAAAVDGLDAQGAKLLRQRFIEHARAARERWREFVRQKRARLEWWDAELKRVWECGYEHGRECGYRDGWQDEQRRRRGQRDYYWSE